MFKFSTITGCFLLLMGGLSGCGGPQLDDNILKVGNEAEPQNLDPHLVSGVPEHRILTALFEGLCTIDPATLAPVPAAAVAWEVSDDGLVYTFHLRKEARWSNGYPVTAQDFVYAWKRILTPALAAEYAYMLHCLKNAQAYHEGVLTDFGQVGAKALDDYTLELTLERPTPYLLSMQIHYTWFPVHQATIERYGAMDDRFNRWTRAGNHVGNGPFVLTEWKPNHIIRVRKSDTYWSRDQVRLAGINFYPIDNQQTEERKFRSGRLHLTANIPLHKIATYRREHPEVLNIHPYMGVYFYRLNTTRKPFDDPRVRRAFSMAIDREAIARNVMKGGEPAAYGLVPPGMPHYPARESVPFDPEQARRLLAEAGYPNGEGLLAPEILYNTSESHKMLAEAVQSMWKKNLNVDVRLLNQDWKVYLVSMNNLDYSVVRSAWIADVNDPVNFLECFLTDGGNNRTGWSSPEYDRLVKAAYLEPDNLKRLALLREAETLLLQEAPIAPVYYYTWKFLKSPEVKGLTLNSLGFIRWADLWLDPTQSGVGS